jgi:protein phosphatase
MAQSDIWQQCLEYAALSDVGMRRANNQDSMAVALAGSQAECVSRGHVFMVADGMGAHAAGELASKIATDSIPLIYQKLRELPPPEALRKAVQDANQLINQRGQSSDDFKGMGTTCTTLALLADGALVAHVGDSRAYRLRGLQLEQLTFDHSLVWEIRAAGQMPNDQVPMYVPKNIITRSLGPNPTVQVDLEGPFPLQAGDTFLVCCDGLTGPIEDKEIGTIMACMPPQQAAQALIDLGNLRGGPDNITVIIARVKGPLLARGGTATAAGAGTPAAAVHPLVWTLLGVFLLGGLLMSAIGQWIAAGACLAGALCAGLAAMVQRLSGGRPQVAAPVGPLGRAPYVRCDCTPDMEFTERLAGITQELRGAAVDGDRVVDWSQFNDFETRAKNAKNSGALSQAVFYYCTALSFMTSELRKRKGG